MQGISEVGLARNRVHGCAMTLSIQNAFCASMAAFRVTVRMARVAQEPSVRSVGTAA